MSIYIFLFLFSSIIDVDDIFSTRAATFEVIINILKGLPGTTLDSAWGLVGLFALYAIRMTCNHLGKKYPRRGESFFSPHSRLLLTDFGQHAHFFTSAFCEMPLFSSFLRLLHGCTAVID